MMTGRRLAVAFLLLAAGLMPACRHVRPEMAGGKVPVRPPAAVPAAPPAGDQPAAPAVTGPPAPAVAAGKEEKPPPAAIGRAEVSRSVVPEPPPGVAGDLIRYGRTIVDNTPVALRGTWAVDRGEPPARQLSCRNCHLEGGTRPGGFPWRGTAAYPRYEARAGRVVSLPEQVNACLVRCLSRPPLPAESREMQAVLAYIDFLPVAPDRGEETVPSPDRGADLAAGAATYQRLCQSCHAEDGNGGREAPPLWGPGSYGTGSPMHRLLTAASFIQGQMPPGATGLTPEEAYDVAAFVNSFVRPETENLHLDYPALTEKPVDAPYPPYPDRFPADLHKYGPFRVMLEAREECRRGNGDCR